jgi:hypothetical protein
MEDVNNSSNFNLEEELAKVILANCLNGPLIRSGIRKKDGHLVLISSVRKNGENFYIPVLTIAEFLQKKFNNNTEFKDLENLKQSFEKLLFDLCDNERDIIKKKEEYVSLDGIRFLGIDGLCYYLGKRIDNLPTFTLGKKTPEDDALRDRWLISGSIAKDIDIGLNKQFELINLYPEQKHEVEKYPISVEQQIKVASRGGYKDTQQYSKAFINTSDGGNIISAAVNSASRWQRNNLQLCLQGFAKYCDKCNFVKDKCSNQSDVGIILNSSFGIDDSLETLGLSSEKGK